MVNQSLLDIHPALQDIMEFYSLPELHLNQVKFSKRFLSQQILHIASTTPCASFKNSFQTFTDDDPQEDNMEIDAASSKITEHAPKPKVVTWSADVGILPVTFSLIWRPRSRKWQLRAISLLIRQNLENLKTM